MDEDITQPSLWGTSVLMLVRMDTERTPQAVFDEFTSPRVDFAFTHTVIPARLVDAELVSRSQAKRLLARCEQFAEVTVDFTDVTSIGPAFADELFRVWPSQHPTVRVLHRGANADVQARIARVRQQGSSGDSST